MKQVYFVTFALLFPMFYVKFTSYVSILPGGSVDNYWQRRYTLLPAAVPSFLTDQVDLILRTGKYLNVIRQSG